MGGTLVRGIGLVRAKARIGLKNLAYNMRRLVQLERLAAAVGTALSGATSRSGKFVDLAKASSLALRVMCPNLTEDDREHWKNVAAFAGDRVLPNVLEWDRRGVLPREFWKELAGQGLLGLPFPEAVGGADGGELRTQPSPSMDSLTAPRTWALPIHGACTRPWWAWPWSNSEHRSSSRDTFRAWPRET